MMKTEMGEYVVGGYLKIIKGCDFIDYNVRPPGGGLEGLNEIDVVGLDFRKKTVFLCEVTTHIIGANYGNNKQTIEKIKTIAIITIVLICINYVIIYFIVK